MLFSSLNNLPPEPLGKTTYAWDYKPPATMRVLPWLGMAAIAGLAALAYFGLGRDLGPLHRYAEILIYAALPLLSILLPRAMAMSRTRYYEFRERGFVIHHGKLDRPYPGTGWAWWKDFDRAELADKGIKIFPKKPLLRRVYFRCSSNRLTVYSHVSAKIAEFRYANLGQGR